MEGLQKIIQEDKKTYRDSLKIILVFLCVLFKEGQEMEKIS